MDERRSGRTTRIVNEIIEELFKNGEAICEDHYNSSDSNRMLSKLVWRRLNSEHPHVATIFDSSNGILKIKLSN